eukprot:GEMP01044142.1.p1 GENE.GEMP01044142.1~~GEMP01044142.1.p1  ORF type:complete len:517 (+),score=114.43 GEMP01044142.1:37-1587(+)
MRRTGEDFFSETQVAALDKEDSVLTRKATEIRTLKFASELVVLQAIEIPERLLAVRTQLARALKGHADHGIREVRLQDALRMLLEAYNFLATQLLQQNSLKSAYELLKKAEQLCKSQGLAQELGIAVTYNNIACYFRRLGKLRTAVHYLERALRVEDRIGSADVSQTHLNLCATLSQLGKHEKAMQHAYIAVIRVYETLIPDLQLLDPQSDSIKERISVLCIAYHNLAVEEEFLKNPNSIETYSQGLRYAEKYLGLDHQIYSILKHSVEAVKKVFAAQQKIRKSHASLTESTTTFAKYDPRATVMQHEQPEKSLSEPPSPERNGTTHAPEGLKENQMFPLPVHEMLPRTESALPEMWNYIGSQGNQPSFITQPTPVAIDVTSTLGAVTQAVPHTIEKAAEIKRANDATTDSKSVQIADVEKKGTSVARRLDEEGEELVDIASEPSAPSRWSQPQIQLHVHASSGSGDTTPPVSVALNLGGQLMEATSPLSKSPKKSSMKSDQRGEGDEVYEDSFEE